MICAYCGIDRIYPDDFPDRSYAECRVCLYARSKKRKMRKNWFKKAKKKFIKKRIFRWILCEKWHSPPHVEVEYVWNEGASLTYCSKDHLYQIIRKAKDLGFIKGFLYAESVAKRDPKSWRFYFDKKGE